MTEVREPGFRLDLPGEWKQIESAEPGSLVYEETGGSGIVTVLLLKVRPVYAIADRKRLLDDYLSHRGKYEKGQMPSLEQSDPVSRQRDDTVEGEWQGVDAATGKRLRHRALLADDVLADFCYEASGMDDIAFDGLAEAVLGSAMVSVE